MKPVSTMPFLGPAQAMTCLEEAPFRLDFNRTGGIKTSVQAVDDPFLDAGRLSIYSSPNTPKSEFRAYTSVHGDVVIPLSQPTSVPVQLIHIPGVFGGFACGQRDKINSALAAIPKARVAA